MDNMRTSKIKFYGYCIAIAILIISSFFFLAMIDCYKIKDGPTIFLSALFYVIVGLYLYRMMMKSSDDYDANKRLANLNVYVVIDHKLYEQYKNGNLELCDYYENNYIVDLPEKHKDREVFINGIVFHKLYLNTDNPYEYGYCKLLTPGNYYYLYGEYTENEYGKIVSYTNSKTEDEILKLISEDEHE